MARRPRGRRDREDREGRRGRRSRRDREDDEDGERPAPPRSSSSAVPFIVMGAFVFVGLIVIAVAMSGSRSRRASQRSDRRMRPQSATPAEAPRVLPPPPRARARLAARKQRRGGSAPAKIVFVQAGFSTGGRDNRYMKASCTQCGASLGGRVEKCPSCAAQLRWRKTVKCEFCCKPEKLKVEGVEDKRGFCAYCGGKSKDPNYRASVDRLPFGMSRGGPGRDARGDCPVCKGSGGCRRCQTQGWLTVPDRFGK